MAIQMAVALALAFVVGFTFFAERWAWVVLTAYIVNAGNQGRLDVAYKSLLRVLGAAAGTGLAVMVTLHVSTHDATTAFLILAAVFLGMWLRPISYAWWALFVTLALALLQGFEGKSTGHILVLRMEEIVIGAIIGVVCAWFVLPVRSRQVLRRRIADALAMLSEALDPATAQRSSIAFEAAIGQVESVAPAFRTMRWMTRQSRHVQPADWIDALIACRDLAIPLIDNGRTSREVRQCVGSARKALREPETIHSALVDLRDALDQNHVDASSPGAIIKVG